MRFLTSPYPTANFPKDSPWVFSSFPSRTCPSSLSGSGPLCFLRSVRYLLLWSLRIVFCVFSFKAALLFSFQGSRHLYALRRRRDLNPRAALHDLHPFQGCPFSHLGYFSKSLSIVFNPLLLQLYGNRIPASRFNEMHRRGWDSNPCGVAAKRFSRPPRYDHFDTSP